jgi:hypothetical protein
MIIDKKHWKVGELARQTRLTVRTLHHYDQIGLLSPSRYSDTGHRLYSGSVVAKLLDYTHDKVVAALNQTRGEIFCDGKILQIEQKRDSRVVTFLFRGYSYSNAFFNAHLRAMCEDAFWRFVTDYPFPSTKT